MKTKLKYICLSAAAGLTLSLGSCSDFMDLTPEDQYDETVVWEDADLTKTVVNDVYSYVCDIARGEHFRLDRRCLFYPCVRLPRYQRGDSFSQ